MKIKRLAAIVIAITLPFLTACASSSTDSTGVINTPASQVSPLDSPLPPAVRPTQDTESTQPIVLVTPMPSKSAIVGQVMSSYTTQPEPLPGTVVRLARVFWNEQQTDGAFALEAGSSPSAITNGEGIFFFSDIEPVDYVIVVGELEGSHVIVSTADGKPRIFSAEQDRILEVGELRVELQP